MLHFGIDAPDVLADEPEGDQEDAGEKRAGHEERRESLG